MSNCKRCNGGGCFFKMNKDGLTWTFVKKCRKCRLIRQRSLEMKIQSLESAVASQSKEIERLRKAIEAAPHDAGGSGCYFLDGNGSDCNCWKAKALSEIKEAK